MKTNIISLACNLLFCALSPAKDEPEGNDYHSAYAAWEVAVSPSSHRELQDSWRNASELVRELAAYDYAQSAIATAENAPKDEAYLLLREAAKVASEYPIVVGYGKNPSHFPNVASVHAKVWGASKSNPFEGVDVGYDMTTYRNGFIAISDSADFEATTAVAAEAALERNEWLGLLVYYDSTGLILQEHPVAIAEGNGSLRSRLNAILKYEPAGSEGTSRCVRLEPTVIFPIQSSATNPPEISQPPTRNSQSSGVNATNVKPTPPSGDMKSLKPWSLIMSVIVATFCLLCVFFKKRK